MKLDPYLIPYKKISRKKKKNYRPKHKTPKLQNF